MNFLAIYFQMCMINFFRCMLKQIVHFSYSPYATHTHKCNIIQIQTLVITIEHIMPFQGNPKWKMKKNIYFNTIKN